MSTARDLIRGSLRLIEAIATGETPCADELADGLTALNELVAGWSNKNLLIFNKVREVFPLVVGQASYTMGPTGNFDTARPQRIENAAVLIPGAQPIEIPIDIINQDEWAAIAVKSVQSSVPNRLYAEGTYPLETLDPWPIPNVANSLVLYSWKPLSSFANANATVDLPPGYYRALRYNLAVEIAPEYGKEVSAAVAAVAVESKADIMRMNSKPRHLSTDEAIRGRKTRFNYLTGE